MHNSAAAKLNLDLVYLPLPVPPSLVKAAISGLPALGFLGVNVTVPHKQNVMPYLDEVETAARAIGAVNTIGIEWKEECAWLTGYNTDAPGFLADLKEMGVEVAARDCLVLGAGGSARAITYALAGQGARVQVLSRRVEPARELVQSLAPHLSSPGHLSQLAVLPIPRLLGELSDACHNVTKPVIINATPVGMHPNIHESVWPEEVPFPKGSVVYDLIYNPAETRLMRQARSVGCHAANGLGMLLRQGALAFQLWTGQTPDLSIMAAAIHLKRNEM